MPSAPFCAISFFVATTQGAWVVCTRCETPAACRAGGAAGSAAAAAAAPPACAMIRAPDRLRLWDLAGAQARLQSALEARGATMNLEEGRRVPGGCRRRARNELWVIQVAIDGGRGGIRGLQAHAAGRKSGGRWALPRPHPRRRSGSPALVYSTPQHPRAALLKVGVRAKSIGAGAPRPLPAAPGGACPALWQSLPCREQRKHSGKRAI